MPNFLFWARIFILGPTTHFSTLGQVRIGYNSPLYLEVFLEKRKCQMSMKNKVEAKKPWGLISPYEGGVK